MTNHGYTAYLLRNLMEGRQLASLFTDPQNPDNFCVGYVEAVNARQVALRSISPQGKFDGFMVKRIADVFQVLSGEEFEQRLLWLLSLNGETDQPLLNEHVEGDLFKAALQAAHERGMAVSLWRGMEEEGLTGTIAAVDDLRLTLNRMDFWGRDAGEQVVALKDISLLEIDTPEERMYQLMNRHEPPQGSRNPEGY